jgi:hypothetical protein
MLGFRKRTPRPPPPPCPECGKPTNLGGRFCRACGWDADHAGSRDAHLDGVDLPEEMDDRAYEDYLEEEGLVFSNRRRRWHWLLVWTTCVALLVAFLLTLIPGF